jgi:hypothetical protein
MHAKSTRMRIVLFCCMLLLFAIGCAIKPQVLGAQNKLFGTWINEEYEYNNYKLIYNSDGKAFVYSKWAKVPDYECRFTIEKTWTDEKGYTYYKTLEIWSTIPFDDSRSLNSDLGPWRSFAVHRINPSGDTKEIVSSADGYPEEFSPVSGDYGVHYRQR